MPCLLTKNDKYRMKLYFLFFIILITCISCSEELDSSVTKYPHAFSPDSSSILYQTYLVGNKGKYHISVILTMKHKGVTGGGCIATVISSKLDTLSITWKSDSLAHIEIPDDIKVSSNKNESYFYGKSIIFTYNKEFKREFF